MRMNLRLKTACLLIIFFCFLGTSYSSRESEDLRWFKGNTHTHTLWSDGDDLPESVADWYKRHGYHFLVLSDHNILSRGEKWKTLRADQALPALAKVEKRWGKGDVKTRLLDGKKQVRLMELDEVRELLEEPGKFILIEGLEMTTDPSGYSVHTNPMNISTLLEVEKNSNRTVQKELALHESLVHRHEHETRNPVFWQANHPNFRFAITGEQLGAARGLEGVEIMNSSSDCFNLGDGRRPSVERIWDIANTIRLKQEGRSPIYGTATDDTHDYHIGDYVMNAPGTSWVMVQARELSPNSITAAMEEGQFYATTGVILSELAFDEEKQTLTVEVDEKAGVNYRIEFKGSLKDVSLEFEPVDDVVDDKGLAHPVTGNYPDAGIGMTFQEIEGSKATYQVSGDALYVRAVIHCDVPPYFKYDEFSDMEQKAWTQPVGWRH